MIDIETLARQADTAAQQAAAIPQLSEKHALTLDQAYQIQQTSIGLRQARGDQIIGVKMGFTSKAKAAQMGVDDLIYGKLTSSMLIPDGGTISMSSFVHHVEPELAFLLNKPLQGNIGMMQAYTAVEAVAPAIEIIDSRYKNFKFSLTDVVADNSSSSAFVHGPWQKRPEDPSNLGMIMSFDHRPISIGSTAAVMGNPVRSLVTAVRMLTEHGQQLEAGQIVLTGGATAAAALRANIYVQAELETLGSVGFAVID